MRKIFFLILVLGFISFTSYGQGTVSRKKEIPKAQTTTSVSSLMDKANDNYEKGNYAEAIRLWKLAAEKGDHDAMYALGSRYYYGEGVTQDSQTAFEWWKKSVDTGGFSVNPGTLYNIGVCYLNGEGVKKDESLGYQYIQDACFRAYNSAYAVYGDCKFWGIGTTINIASAINNYEKGAKAGDPYAQYRYSMCLYDGTGIEENDEQGFEWALKSAMNGYTKAYSLLAAYQQKKDHNNEEAVNWVKKGADKGDRYCIYLLGECYIKGQGVEKDPIKGLELYREAARKGEELAIEVLKSRNLSY